MMYLPELPNSIFVRGTGGWTRFKSVKLKHKGYIYIGLHHVLASHDHPTHFQVISVSRAMKNIQAHVEAPWRDQLAIG